MSWSSEELQEILRAYQVAAEWSSLYRDDIERPPEAELPGEFIDSVSNEGWSPEAIADSLADIKKFCDENQADLFGMPLDDIGHDFWLTRHHHGVGFWCRKLGPAGDRLTKAAQTFREVSLWINSEKKVCLE